MPETLTPPAPAAPRFVPAKPFGTPGSTMVPLSSYLSRFGAPTARPVVTPPASPRFVPAARRPSSLGRLTPRPPAAPRFIPAPSDTPPSTLGRTLSMAKAPVSLAGLFASKSPSLNALGGALSLAGGIENLVRGRTIPGVLDLGSAGAAGLRTYSALQEPAREALRAAGQAVPTNYLTEGPGGGLAGAAAAALGVGSGIYDITQGGSGEAIPMALASWANPAFGLVYGASQLAGMGMDWLTGQGMFGPTPLPIAERGRGFSSAENAPSQISKMTGIQGAKGLQAFIEKTTNPGALLSLAIAGPALSPHGEVQFSHPVFGHGGDADDPTSPAFSNIVQQIWQTGDPGLLRQFISGIQIQTGESGAAAPNFALTDWYRRQLVASLPANHPLRQDTRGLFEPVPESYLEPLRYMAAIPVEQLHLGAGLDRGFSPEDLTDVWGSPYAPPMLSAFGRTPEEVAALKTLHERAAAVRTNPDLAQYVDRQISPGYYPVGGTEGAGEAVPFPSQIVAAKTAALTNREGFTNYSPPDLPPSLVPRVPQDVYHSGYHANTGEPVYTSSTTGAQYTASEVQADRAAPPVSLAQQYADLNAYQREQEETVGTPQWNLKYLPQL